MKPSLFLLATAASLGAFAGGSNYNVTPGALPTVTGQVREWAVPTPKFARDPAPAPDGTLYIAVMNGNIPAPLMAIDDDDGSEFHHQYRSHRRGGNVCVCGHPGRRQSRDRPYLKSPCVGHGHDIVH